jgi:hypothetical protein
LIEVIQNADDLHAHDVRFALRNVGGRQQLLMVHDGDPVAYAHVMAMTLPFLTTKEDDAGQKGRFGIGLKTLARISSALSVHSAPYHFTARHLSLSTCAPEPALARFYDPEKDTLLVLDLTADFDPDELEHWFQQWSEEKRAGSISHSRHASPVASPCRAIRSQSRRRAHHHLDAGDMRVMSARSSVGCSRSRYSAPIS